MRKLPVSEIVTESFKFPITHFGALLRRTILPFGLLIAAFGAFFSVMVPMVGANAAALEAAALASGGLAAVLFLVIIVVQPMILNGVIQVVLGDPMGEKWFSFGTRELRFLLFIPLGLAVMAFIALAIAVVLFVTALLVGGELPFGGADGSPVGYIVALPLGFALFFFTMVRLLPLYGFIAIENRFAVMDAWEASQNNFWRILGALVLIGFCASIISGVASAIGSAIAPLDMPGLVGVVEAAPEKGSVTDDEGTGSLVFSLLILGLFQVPVMFYAFFVQFCSIGLIYKFLKEDAPTEMVEQVPEAIVP